MVGLVACPTVMGDVQMDGEGASGTGVWDGNVTRLAIGCGAVGHGAAADEHAVVPWEKGADE
jgi:hypothetical protein